MITLFFVISLGTTNQLRGESLADIVFDRDSKGRPVSLSNIQHDCIYGLDVKHYCIGFSPEGKVYVVETVESTGKVRAFEIPKGQINRKGLNELNKVALEDGKARIKLDLEKLEVIGKKTKEDQAILDGLKKFDPKKDNYDAIANYIYEHAPRLREKLERELAALTPAQAKKVQSKLSRLNNNRRYFSHDEKKARWINIQDGNLFLVDERAMGGRKKTLLIKDYNQSGEPLVIEGAVTESGSARMRRSEIVDDKSDPKKDHFE